MTISNKTRLSISVFVIGPNSSFKTTVMSVNTAPLERWYFTMTGIRKYQIGKCVHCLLIKLNKTYFILTPIS